VQTVCSFQVTFQLVSSSNSSSKWSSAIVSSSWWYCNIFDRTPLIRQAESGSFLGDERCQPIQIGQSMIKNKTHQRRSLVNCHDMRATGCIFWAFSRSRYSSRLCSAAVYQSIRTQFSTGPRILLRHWKMSHAEPHGSTPVLSLSWK
jgi:hypothetical protein